MTFDSCLSWKRKILKCKRIKFILQRKENTFLHIQDMDSLSDNMVFYIYLRFTMYGIRIDFQYWRLSRLYHGHF